MGTAPAARPYLVPLVVGLLAVASTSCDDAVGTLAPPPGGFDPLLGLGAFEHTCAECHASRDGADLAMFAMPDSAIVRRAVFHVDSTTALHIAAHIRSLSLPTLGRTARILQPGGRLLAGGPVQVGDLMPGPGGEAEGDLAFALELMGRDAWPAAWTAASLRQVDPLGVAVALPMPLWSEEGSNLDWMPGAPLPDGVLDWRDGMVRERLGAYYANPTHDNLDDVVDAIRWADGSSENPDAPCRFDAGTDFEVCFETRRWAASLVAQHMLRYGLTGTTEGAPQRIFWDVGNAARRSDSADRPLVNADANWAIWMYLGWVYAPGTFTSHYTAGGLSRMGMPRLAAFMSLRTLVARDSASHSVYDDVETTARFAPDHWVGDATSFGFRHLLERLAGGEIPATEDVPSARAEIESAFEHAASRMPEGDVPALRALADSVQAAIP